MHAARSRNAMTLSEVVQACQRACDPHTVRGGLLGEPTAWGRRSSGGRRGAGAVGWHEGNNLGAPASEMKRFAKQAVSASAARIARLQGRRFLDAALGAECFFSALLTCCHPSPPQRHVNRTSFTLERPSPSVLFLLPPAPSRCDHRSGTPSTKPMQGE